MIEIQVKALSVNRLFKGRRFKTQEYKDYEEFLLYSLPKKPMIKGMVNIHYKFFLKNHKITDCSNLVKALEDILVKKGYIVDDRFVYKFTVEKIPSIIDKIQIELYPYNLS